MSNSSQNDCASLKSLFFRLSEFEITPIAPSRPWNFLAKKSTRVESIPPEKATNEPFRCLNQFPSIWSFSFREVFSSFMFIYMLDTFILIRITIWIKNLFGFTHNQFAMLNAFNSNELIRKFSQSVGGPFNRNNLHTVLFAQVKLLNTYYHITILKLKLG